MKNKYREIPVLNAILIKLTQGQATLIDIADCPLVKEFKWYAHRERNGWTVKAYISTGKTVIMHRLIMDPHPNMDVDHRDGNTLDNRRSNLRICTRSQNLCNQGPRGGTSKYKGVSWGRCSWQARIYFNNKCVYLGRFKDEIEAARTYDEAARQLHGEFARLNFPYRGDEGRTSLGRGDDCSHHPHPQESQPRDREVLWSK